MSSQSVKQLESNPDGWRIAKATVISCRRQFFSGGKVYETGGPASPTTYIATFEYQVEDKKYSGKMKRGTPVAPGHHFEISYNPTHPSRNTGSDFQITWIRIIGWVIGMALVGAVIYFQNR